MDATTLMVIGPSADLGRSLMRLLPPSRFEVIQVLPGAGLLRGLRWKRPRIAIIDRIDDRPESAQLEIALMKEMYPDAPIIAVSANSSTADACVVEQGIFCYVAAPEDDELVRIIHAAFQAAEVGAMANP